MKAGLFRLFFFASFAVSVFPQTEIALTGIIEIADEDDKGVIRAVTLSCMNEVGEYDYYPIRGSGRGKDLLKLVGETVKIKGTLFTDKEKNRSLEVAEFTLIRDEAMDREPDEDL